LAVGRLIILHADRPSDLALEGVEDRRARRVLVDRPEAVEIPIIVVPEGPPGLWLKRGGRRAAIAAVSYRAAW
jgi:hypothetical protein